MEAGHILERQLVIAEGDLVDHSVNIPLVAIIIRSQKFPFSFVADWYFGKE